MTAHTLTLPQAHVLLTLSLEPQSVNDLLTRLAKRGHQMEPSSVRFLLKSLVTLGLAVLDRRHQGAKLHYRLAHGVAVEAALEQAYELVTRK